MIFSLSNPAEPGEYINKVKGLVDYVVGYEMGSLELFNPAGGLLQQLWTVDTDGSGIYLSAPNHARQLVLQAPEVTQVDLAFDQNMYPFIAFVSLGVTKFYWYDSQTSQFEITTLDGIVKTPRCTLDDKRKEGISNSDIVLLYIDAIAGQLAYRLQRERYATQHNLMSVDKYDVVRCVNFAANLRLQMTLDNFNPQTRQDTHKGMRNFTRPISITGAYIA